MVDPGSQADREPAAATAGYPAWSAFLRFHCRGSAVVADSGDREAALQAAWDAAAAVAVAAVDSDELPAALVAAAAVEADAAAADDASSSRAGHTKDDRHSIGPSSRPG